MYLISVPYMFYSTKKMHRYRQAASNCLIYLLETRICLTNNFFISIYVNSSIKDEFKRFNCIDYSRYTHKDIFGFVKLYLLKKLDCLVDQPIMEMIIGNSYSKTEIPRILQKIYKKNDNVYSIRVIQLLFYLMVYTDQTQHINNTSKLYLMSNFIPLFFGDKVITKLKKKSPEKYHTLVARWCEIVKYLPKGLLAKKQVYIPQTSAHPMRSHMI